MIRSSFMFRFLLAVVAVACVASCKHKDEDDTFSLRIQLDGSVDGADSCVVKLRDASDNVFTALFDDSGVASFLVPSGVYEASFSSVVSDGYYKVVYNASRSGIVVGSSMDDFVLLPLSVTTLQTANPVVIKELYCGGCQKDDGSGKFTNDKCIILYNNSSHPVSLASMAIGMVEPYNAEAAAHNFLVNGALTYEADNWIPCINGIWYFPSTASIEPYSQLVVNICGAIDNTLSYSNSVNYAHSDYYCMYDPEATSPDGGHYNNTSYYPSPSEVIPTSHYLKAVKYGKGNAWPISQNSPAVLLFSADNTTPQAFASDEANIVYPSDKQGNLVYACLRLPRAWVVDAVEVYNADALANCKKRLTSDLDNGYVALTSGYGHSLVRKLDSQASLDAGHDVYLDTNNSTNDFYEADKCSIK